MAKTKLKLYRVYLDEPGYFWEELVKARTAKTAIKAVCKIQKCTDCGVIAEKVPNDYLVKRAKVEELERVRDDMAVKLAKDYATGISVLMDEYKQKINNVWSTT